MTVEKAFNNSINEFITEQPNSSASDTIRLIAKSYPGFRSYYSLFDDFAYKLGLGIIAQEIVDDKTSKTIGYIPCLQYYPGNKLNEESRVQDLVSYLSPYSLLDCYSFVAKELLYRIMGVKDLKEIINELK